MKSQIQAIISKLDGLRERAEEMQDSENDKTVERYELVADAIETAINALDEAIEAFEG